MAHMSQERKATIAPVVKAILKKYNIQGTLSVRHHSSLVLNIKSGKIDFIKDYNTKAGTDNYARGFEPASRGYLDVNPYYLNRDFSETTANIISELHTAMNEGNFDKSEPQADYFHVGWYTDINIGQWDKPYIVKE